MRKLTATLCLLLLSSIVGIAAAAGAPTQKWLWLADFDNDTIWVMNLDTRTVVDSYPSPGGFPIGTALLRGRLYVNDWGSGANEIFVINKLTGTELASALAPGVALDGMAAIPEAGLLLAIDSRTDPEQLLVFDPAANANDFALNELGAIDVQVPGDAVRGLAYNHGMVFVATETWEPDLRSKIFIYKLDLATMSLLYEGQIDLGEGIAAPGLASYGDHLIAYNIVMHELYVVEAKPEGVILETISLTNTPIGGVGAIETQMTPTVYDNAP